MTIIRLVRNGPDESDGTLGWLFGHMIWWRFWVTALLVGGPFVLGLVVYASHGGFWGVAATAMAHVLTFEKAMQVNPKYDVTKNY